MKRMPVIFLAMLCVVTSWYSFSDKNRNIPDHYFPITPSLAGTAIDSDFTAGILFGQPGNVLFLENKGQVIGPQGEARPDLLFTAEGQGCRLFVRADGLSYQFERAEYPEGAMRPGKGRDMEEELSLAKEVKRSTHRIDMRLLGANPSPKVAREKENPYFENHYNVPDFPEGKLKVRSYEKLHFENVYPEIDWVLYSNGQGLKYDFVVHPGGDPADIRMDYSWAEELALKGDGSLAITTSLGTITEAAPVCFQGEKEIKGRFVLEGRTVSIVVEDYDERAPLVIDPVVAWSTFYGGSNYDVSRAVATDADGNVYLGGFTYSEGLAAGGHQNSLNGLHSAFLAKFNASGVRLWATYYGCERSNGFAIATVTEASGNAYVYLAGSSSCSSDVAYMGHQNDFYGGGTLPVPHTAFLVKFDAISGVRQWGTYYGGSKTDVARGVAVDNAGNVYLAGGTNSLNDVNGPPYTNNVVATDGAHQTTLAMLGRQDAFLVKFNSNGVRQWGTYFGGYGGDVIGESATSITTDDQGNVYMTGYTDADAGFDASIVEPGENAHQEFHAGGGTDAFLAKFDTDGNKLWSTYYGGHAPDEAQSVTTDDMGNVYIAGTTESTNEVHIVNSMPVPFIATEGAHQENFKGFDDLGGGFIDNNNAFLAKFDANGQRQWATYYGGAQFIQSWGTSVVTDALGSVYLAGWGGGDDVAECGFQNTPGGDADAFVVKFDPQGVRQWGTYFGGTNSEYIPSIAAYEDGNNVLLYLAGSTQSTNNIGTGGFQNTSGGGFDAFLAKFLDSPCPQMLYLNPNTGNDNNNGTSWNNALRTLQAALAIAQPGDEIYLAAGVYYPSQVIDLDNSGGSDPREAAFYIPGGVKLYGGFSGSEGPVDQAVLNSRDLEANLTILSGDLGVSGDPSDNAYHVVVTSDAIAPIVADGLTITAGNANGNGINANGGAWLNIATENTSSPTLRNVTITQNSASSQGGGMYNDAGGSNLPPALANPNPTPHATAARGVLTSNATANPTLINVVFSQNLANLGGALFNHAIDMATASPALINCTFAVNTAATNGGALYNQGNNAGICSPSLANCLFWGNTDDNGLNSWFNNNASPSLSYSLVEEADETAITTGQYAGTVVGQGIIYAQDPLFVNSPNSLGLQYGSPAVDAGDGSAVPSSVVTDLAGNPRIQDAAVDIGAYEQLEGTLPTPSCQDITLPLNASGQATLTPEMVDPQATPPTDPFTWSVSQTTFDCSGIGPEPVAVTLSVTDGTSTNSCTFNVNLELEAECLTSPLWANLIDPGDGTDPVAYIWATDVLYIPFDCYSVVSTDPSGPWTFGCEDIGQNLVSVTVTLDNGYSSTCEATITINDPLDTYSCHDFTLQLDETGQATLQPEDVVNAATLCGNFPDFISLSQTNFDCSHIGMQTVTVSIAPPLSAPQTCEVAVEVVDLAAPTLTCQDITLELDENGQATLTPEMIAPDLSDNCGYPTTYLSHTLFDCNGLGDPGPNFALEFLGLRREYVQFMSPLTGYADFTLEAWFVNENMQDVFPTYLISWLGTGLEVFDNEGDLYVGLGNVLAPIPVPTRDGQWHHIAIVKEGNTAIVYLDGEAQWTSPANANVNLFVTDAFQLGRRFSTAVNGQGPWMGRIDELRIWNTARSALEIQGHRFNQLQGAEAGLAGYWPLNDGPGSTTAADASPNDNHGALSSRLIQDTPWVDGAPLTTGNAATVLLTATDGAGNTSSCMATVSVLAGPLQAHCRDIFVQLDENGQASISPEDVDFGSYASCSALSLFVSPAAFSCEDVGINTVTLSAMDDDGEAANCTAQVTVGQSFLLYGTGSLGGSSLYSMRPDGSGLVTYDGFSFDDFGGTLGGDFVSSPNIILAPDGFLYGITEYGGTPAGANAYGSGTLFKVRPDGSDYEVLHDFDGGVLGAEPYFKASLHYSAICGELDFEDCFLYGTAEVGGINSQNFGIIFRYRQSDDLYEVVHRFSLTDGWKPHSGLTAGDDGFLYGTAHLGGNLGPGSGGVIYRFLPPPVGEEADVTMLHTFMDHVDLGTQREGSATQDELLFGEDGWLYGITSSGGNGNGTLFRFDPEGLVFEKIYTFENSTGGHPWSTPIALDNGYLYGTANQGGAFGSGVVYRILPDAPVPADTYEVFKYVPRTYAGLTYAPDGYLYGASFGLANDNGAIFRLNPNDPDDFTIIHTFDGGPADNPVGKPTNRLILVPTSCCDDDLFAPELTCPSTVELIDLDGNGTETITDLSAHGFSAFDDCTEATMSIGPEVFPQGSTEAVVTAVDEGGNTTTCTVTVVVTGPCTDEEMKIITSDGAGKYFGNSVGISGAKTVVGAYGDNANGNNSGSAYIYHWNGFDWEEYKLIPGDGNAGDYFGFSVAISGDRAIVGAYGDDDNGSSSGSAYLFHWDGANWIQQQKITAADGSFGDLFGYSVAIEGETAIVGAYGDDGKGSAYLFNWDGASWAQQQKITALDGAANDYFGRSVAIDAGRAIVGAYLDDDNGEASGSAYLYHWDGDSWEYQQKITASAPHPGAPGDWFGYSVSISGNKALVGAFGDDDEATLEDRLGSAYLFIWNASTLQWEQKSRATASDGQGGDDFGYSVSISEDQAIIGAPKSTPYGFSSGSAYLFEWDGLALVEREKLTAFDGEAGDSFGQSVGISGNRAIVGAYREDENGNNAGAAYPFLIADTAPDLSVAPPAPVCPGTSVDLSSLAVTDANNTGAVLSYHSGSPATAGNELPSPVVTPASPSSTYYILGTSPAGCTDEVAVTLHAPTTPAISCQDITVELGPFAQQAVVFPNQVASFVPPCSGYALYFQGGNTALPPLPMIFSGCSSAGEYPVTVFLYTGDGNRRRRSCRVTITVLAPPPLANCNDNFNISLGPDGTVALNPADIDGGSYAVCGSIADMAVSPAALSCADVGVTEVTLTVTTDGGQAASCTAEINVNPWPGELCDGIDNNCNEEVDEGCLMDIPAKEKAVIGAVGDTNNDGALAGAPSISPTGPGSVIRPVEGQLPGNAATFALYPNPALAEVFLEFETPLAGDAEVWVYDLAGRPVLRRPLEAGTDKAGIPVQGLVSGLYLLEVKSGEQVFEVKRFVKGGE